MMLLYCYSTMWLLLLYYDAYVIWDLVLTLFYLCGICDDDFFKL